MKKWCFVLVKAWSQIRSVKQSLANQIQVLGLNRKNAMYGLDYPLTDQDGDCDSEKTGGF